MKCWVVCKRLMLISRSFCCMQFFSRSPRPPGPVRNGGGLAVTDFFLQNTMPKNVGLLPINSGSVAKDQWPTILRLKKQLMFKTACIWIMLVHVASFSAGYGYFLFLFNPRNPRLLFVPLHRREVFQFAGLLKKSLASNNFIISSISLLWFSSATNALVRWLLGDYQIITISSLQTSMRVGWNVVLRCGSCCFLAINLGPKSPKRIPRSKPLQSNMWLCGRQGTCHMHICVVYLVANKIKYEVHYKIWCRRKSNAKRIVFRTDLAGGFNHFPSEVSWSNWTIWWCFRWVGEKPPTRYSLEALPVLESSFKPCRLPWRKRVSWAEAERLWNCVSLNGEIWDLKKCRETVGWSQWVVVDMKFQRLGKVQLKVLVLKVQKFG